MVVFRKSGRVGVFGTAPAGSGVLLAIAGGHAVARLPTTWMRQCGLCGTNDGVNTNEYTRPDGVTVDALPDPALAGVVAPWGALWRVPAGGSLFRAAPTYQCPALPDPHDCGPRERLAATLACQAALGRFKCCDLYGRVLEACITDYCLTNGDQSVIREAVAVLTNGCPATQWCPARCPLGSQICTRDGRCVCPTCGNGVVEPGEECDGGRCCTADTCRFAPRGTRCGLTDDGTAVTCTGASATCPTRPRPCPSACSGHGRCDTTTGRCNCVAPWTGDDCSILDEPAEDIVCAIGGDPHYQTWFGEVFHLQSVCDFWAVKPCDGDRLVTWVQIRHVRCWPNANVACAPAVALILRGPLGGD